MCRSVWTLEPVNRHVMTKKQEVRCEVSSALIPPSRPLTPTDTPSQRVQFILGTEEDAEHVAHELFTELDEICVKEGKDAEWKETARSGSPLGVVGNSVRLKKKKKLLTARLLYE